MPLPSAPSLAPFDAPCDIGSPSSTTQPIAIPARSNCFQPLGRSNDVFGCLVDGQERIYPITDRNHPLQQFAHRRRLPLNLVFDRTEDSFSSGDDNSQDPIPLVVSFSPCSSLRSPLISAPATGATEQRNLPAFLTFDGALDVYRFNDGGFLNPGPHVDSSKSWTAGRTAQTKFSSSVPSSTLPIARHHYRNSLRSLKNLTLLPGGIRISKETGDVDVPPEKSKHEAEDLPVTIDADQSSSAKIYGSDHRRRSSYSREGTVSVESPSGSHEPSGCVNKRLLPGHRRSMTAPTNMLTGIRTPPVDVP